jgi:uncharacterized protein YegL
MSKLKDFSIATARMMPVIILADVSGSMTAYGKLAALNRAIVSAIAIFASGQDAPAQIHVAVITFGGLLTPLRAKNSMSCFSL